VLVVGLTGVDVSEALVAGCRSDQVVLDLVNLRNRSAIQGQVEGLCW
jgi:hypothetical protein